MRAIFFITCAIIVYGSLYPFNFSASQLSEHGISELFNFDIRLTRLSDLISNIVLFIPYGFLCCAAFGQPKRLPQYLGWLVFGFVFAFAIQVLQLWTVGRVPWGGDAIWNAVGCIIGFALFAFVKLDAFNQVRALEQFKQVSFALACALIILKLSPFAPALDLQMLKDNIKALIRDPSVDVYWLYEHTLFWLSAFFLLHVAKPEWASLKRVSLIVVVVLSAKFIIVSNNINLSQLLAGVLALLILSVFKRQLNAWILAIFMLVAILGNGLYPFEFRSSPADFNWLPFTGAIRGNILLNILAMSKKLLFYGATVWLLFLSLKSLKKAALISACVVLVSEVLQQFVTNSVPESTDVFLVFIIAFILHTLLHLDTSVQASPQQSRDVSTTGASGNILSRFFDVVPVHQSLHYIHSLDGLRAVAALAVFVVHFQQFSGLSGSVGPIDFERLMINGNTGVALFFTLSGFLLSVPFWQKLKVGTRPKLRQYFTNRIVRIVPIYYLCIFALLALKGFSGADVNFNNIVSHMLFAHNLKDYQVMSLNPPFWTLAVEFQFYLILPLFFIAFAKFGYKASQILTLLMIASVYFTYRLMMHQLELRASWPIEFGLIWPLGVHIESVDGMALKYSLFAHLPHFLIGVFIASLWQYRDKLAPILCELIFWIALASVLLILSTSLDETLQLDYGRYNFPFIPVLLALIVFTAPLARSAKIILEWPLIKWMGIISYGIYVFHYPIQKGMERIFKHIGLSASEDVWLFALAALLLTLFVSHVSYVVLERPILERFKAKRNKNGAQHTAAELTKSPLASSAAASAYDVKTTHVKKGPVNMTNHTQANTASAPYKRQLLWGAGIAAILIAFVTFYVYQADSGARYAVKQAPWATTLSRPLIFDHHAHTTYSDGSKSIEELAEMAYFRGCDAFSITDHSQQQSSVSEQKFTEIQAARAKYPGMMIFAGSELGMPSYDGREHVNVLATPDIEREVLFGVMNALSRSSEMDSLERDLYLFDAIKNAHPKALEQSLAIYNHPSRKDLNEEGDENLADIRRWSQSGLLIGMSGAPGHQNKAATGSYETNILPIDRWDPVAATVGGTWDQLLSEGKRFWAAIASSDYHNDDMDYAPCEFSRMHLTVPEPSYQGVIEALKAGTFWADHGNLLDSFALAVQLDDFKSMTLPGGTLVLTDVEQILSLTLGIERGSDFRDDFMRADIITNCGAENVVASSTYLPPEQNRLSSFLSLAPAQSSCFVRARVVRETAEIEDLSAYSNPIFIEVNP